MPFNQEDIYTSSGSVMLHNAWTPYVSKYDTSSFYNWEQDNLPLYDLEERTYELWEQAGFPTSAVPGLALTVSADTPADTLAADSTIFTDLSSCIAAIPKVVRFPVLIEVGNFGDLGKLELHNFRIEEEGSIEIINRAFARAYTASSTVSLDRGSPSDNASHSMVRELSSLDLSNTLTDTSCLHISTPVLSGAGDIRATDLSWVVRGVSNQRSKPQAVSIQATTLWGGGGAHELRGVSYEHSPIAGDNSLGTLDVSATSQSTENTLYRTGWATTTNTDILTGNVYLNYCTKISVKNCDGPIYIRNFFSDGEIVRKNAIEITNSDVLLENCAGVRAQEAGFKFNNSRVTLSRSAHAYRNYKLLTSTTREAEVGYGFHALNSEVLVSSLPWTGTKNSYAEDYGGSGADCCIAASRNYAGFVLENSKLTGGIRRTDILDENTESTLASELNTGYGMLLFNSKINLKGLIDIYGNDKGIQADGTNVVFENLCIDAHSGEGIRARNSSFVLDSVDNPEDAGQSVRKQLDMSGNGQHIDLQSNSSFGFKRKNRIPDTYGNSNFENSHGVIEYDGAKKSTLPAISVNDGSVADLLHARILVNDINDNIASVPSYGRAIRATNNSKVSLFGSKTGCTFVWGPAGVTYQSKMAGLYGDKGSTINLHGPTLLAHFGVDALVEDNSTLNISPARTRDSFGLEVSGFNLEEQENHTSVELHSTRACLVANKNSTINMQDLGAFNQNWARGTNGAQYLIQGVDYPIGTFDTSTYIANGSLQFYPNPQDTNAIATNNLDDLITGEGYTIPDFPRFTALNGINRLLVTSEIISAGYSNDLQSVTRGGMCVRATENSVVNAKNVHFPIGTNTSPLDGHYYTTSASECEELMIWNIADTSKLQASYLSVSGTHPGDGLYHGPSALYASAAAGTGGGPDNEVPASGMLIGTPDTGSLSILDAYGAGSAVWTAVSGGTINNKALGIAGYPFVDTLDDFGGTLSGFGNTTDGQKAALVEQGIIVSSLADYEGIMFGAGPHVSRNQGVFRIYWSVHPSAKILQSDLSGYFEGSYPRSTVGAFSGVVGPAHQLFAQGYNCSAALSAINLFDPGGDIITSSIHPNLIKYSIIGTDGYPNGPTTSGVYYCSDFVEENPTQCILDESASEAFANAKNATLGISGRPKKVTVYKARAGTSLNRGTEAFPGDTSGSVGLKSTLIFDLSRDN